MSGNYAIEWGQGDTTMRVEAPDADTAMRMYADLSVTHVSATRDELEQFREHWNQKVNE